MVGEQRPAVAGSGGLGKDPSQPIKEVLPVGIVLKDLPPLDASDQHMVQRPWGVDPGLSWHGATIVSQRWDSKL